MTCQAAESRQKRPTSLRNEINAYMLPFVLKAVTAHFGLCISSCLLILRLFVLWFYFVKDKIRNFCIITYLKKTTLYYFILLRRQAKCWNVVVFIDISSFLCWMILTLSDFLSYLFRLFVLFSQTFCPIWVLSLRPFVLF